MSSYFTHPTRPLPSPVDQHPAPVHLSLADRLCRTLAEQHVDCAPLAWLARALDTPAAELRTAVEYTPHLGIDDGTGAPVLYCLPYQPIAAGFQAQCRGDRMWLRLPGYGLRPALSVSGWRVGPVPEEDRARTLGAGELAHAVCRLTLMAADWLPVNPDPTRYLFGLVTEAWRHVRTIRRVGGLATHRAAFDRPVADGPEGVTDRLELVTLRRASGHELLNVYPVQAGERR